MNIKRTLSLYHDNVKMADSLNLNIPGNILILYGEFDFNNYISFKRGDFRFKISKEFFCMFVEVSIWVDDILVYNDGWNHNVPIEMKNKLKEIIKEIRIINKEYKKMKLTKMYNVNEKFLKLKKKQRENENYKKEQQYLLSKFK